MTAYMQSFLLLKLAEVLGVVAVLLIAGTSGRLLFRPVDFKYPAREGHYSIGLFVVIFALAFFYYRMGIRIGFTDQEVLLPYSRQFLLAIICLAVTTLLLFYRRQPLLSAGWGRRQNFNLGLRMGIMLAFLSIILRGKVSALINGLTASEGLALLLILGICVAEESIFRGYLQLRFSSWLGQRNGWLITAGLFVLWRIPFLLLDLPGFWLNISLLIVQSLLLGWVMQKCGHVLAPALYRTVSDWLILLQ